MSIEFCEATVGDKVQLKEGNIGTVRFMGEIETKDGIYYGIELSRKKGKNNGTLNGIKYFESKPKYGIFVKSDCICKTNSKHNANAPRVKIGDKVKCSKINCNGIVRFIGTPYSFKSNGIYYGLELEKPNGQNNGTVKNRSYFQCQPKYGIFVQSKDIRIRKKMKRSNSYSLDLSNSSILSPLPSPRPSQNDIDALPDDGEAEEQKLCTKRSHSHDPDLRAKVIQLQKSQQAISLAHHRKREKVFSLQTENERLRDQRDKLQSQFNKLQTKTTSLQSQNDSLQHRLSRYQPRKQQILQRVLAVIICIGEYDTQKDLTGPATDKQKLIKVFKEHYNYHIICNKSTRVTESDIWAILDEARRKFISKSAKYQCIKLFWSGHGKETELISSDGHLIKRTKVEKYFNGIQASDKLFAFKFMFFDSCRGTEDSCTIYMDDPEDNIGSTPIGQRKGTKDNTMRKEIHPEENRCIMYSNTPTYVSYDVPSNERPKSKAKSKKSNKDDDKKSDDKDNTFSAPFVDGIVNVFTQNAVEMNYDMNFSEIQDEIRDLAQNRMIRKDDRWGNLCRLKVDESSTLRNKDKICILFGKAEITEQHKKWVANKTENSEIEECNIEYL